MAANEIEMIIDSYVTSGSISDSELAQLRQDKDKAGHLIDIWINMAEGMGMQSSIDQLKGLLQKL